jgi:hypothetical protein
MGASERTPAESAEALAQQAWRSVHLPPASGVLGPSQGPWIRQLLGSFAPGDAVGTVVARAVQADAEARFLALAGHRVSGTLREVRVESEAGPGSVGELLRQLGVWTGGVGGKPWDATERTSRVQTLLERLARSGLITLRSGTVRLCPQCGATRSPERTVYREKVGDTFLVRFPLGGDEPLGDAVAWVDAPWRLVGATALLVNPDLPYVVVDYSRDGSKARLVFVRSALERIADWLPGGRIETVRELRGRDLAGVPYAHPLRHEFPRLATLERPAGTVQPALDVGDSGTGVVPLVPSHGGSDAQIAERLGVVGLPLLTEHGTFDPTETHKYASLELDAANEFVLRDLTENSSVLARLRVLRGVPYCAVCGSTVVWVPGRAWRIDLAQLPAAVAERYPALLPGEPPLAQLELTPWPVSEASGGGTDSPGVTLSECDRCEELGPPGAPADCSCGGHRTDVNRELLPAFEGAVAAWAARGAEDAEAEIRLYLNESRRVPAVIYHLVAIASLDAEVGDLVLRLVPSGPAVNLATTVAEHGPDAVRASFLSGPAGRSSTASLAARARQERQRLGALLDLARSVASARGRVGSSSFTPSSLEPVDRAVLARFAEVDRAAIGHYENGEIAEAYRRLQRFVDDDLALYRTIVGAADGSGGSPSLGALPSLLESVAALLAPVAPFTAEAVHATIAPGETPLFTRTPFSLESPPSAPDDRLRWQEWVALLRALQRFRERHHLAPDAALERVAVMVDEEAVAERLRTDVRAIERVAHIGAFEVGSPAHPWAGKLQRIVPVEEEVAKAYPAIAPQVVHLLRRLPPRGPGIHQPLTDVSVVVAGLPRPIAPKMLKVAEELPSGVVRETFALGELFVQLPGTGASLAAPQLSADATWLVRRIARRLKAGPPTSELPTALIVADDPLASELRAHARGFATTLGLARLDVDDAAPALRPPNRLEGRTRTGHPWSVLLWDVPPPPPRRKRRSAVERSRPIVIPGAGEPVGQFADYLDPGLIAREEGIRALADEIDGALGVAALGPAKAASAWDGGFRSLEAIVEAPFVQVASLRGFGRPVAAALFAGAGRPVPPAPRAERIPSSQLLVESTARATPAPSPASRPAPPALPLPVPLPSLTQPAVVVAEPPRPTPTIPDAEPIPSAPVEAAVASGPVASNPPEMPALHRAGRGGVELGGYSSFTAAALPFLEATSSGHRGLAIVRTTLDRMRAIVGARKVSVRPLTGSGGDGALDPHDLQGLTSAVRAAVDNEHVAAVFFEGFEMLVELHGFDPSVAWLEELDRLTRTAGVPVWVHLNEPLLGPGRVAGLKRTFAVEATAPSSDAALEPSDTAMYHG